MMANASPMNVNNQMSGGMQMQTNNPMGGNVATPNMSAMNTGPMSGNPIGSNTSLASPASAVASPIPHMGNMNNLGSPIQPGMAMKPGAQTPPANVLQVVKEVQEEAARQGCGSFGKNLPVAGSMPPPPMQRGMNVNMGMQQQNAMMSPQPQVNFFSSPFKVPNQNFVPKTESVWFKIFLTKNFLQNSNSHSNHHNRANKEW